VFLSRREDQSTPTSSGWWLWRLNPLALVLWPLSLVFCGLASLRRGLYSRGFLNSQRIGVPVAVVGNISVGGNGKTPIVVSMVRLLKAKGYRVGLLSRGYKSDLEQQVRVLEGGATDQQVGDEANMLSELCQCPIAIGADRVRAAEALVQQLPELDLLISDDGLQHYSLARDAEIIVLRQAALGNGLCLPAGPLREPRGRLDDCDLLIRRDGSDVTERFGECWNLAAPAKRRQLESFSDEPVYALAAIGFPDLFFDQLRAAGLDVVGNGFPDHFAFSAADIEQFSDRPLLVTHKDAVKLRVFASDNIWVVPLELELSDDLQYRLLTLLENIMNG
jgi:tetraacyldisaccharide 4'-kinase